MLNGHEKKSTLLLVAKFSMWHSQFPSCKSLYMVNFVIVSEVATFPTFPKVKPFFLKLSACVASHVDLSVHVEKFTPRYQISLI